MRMNFYDCDKQPDAICMDAITITRNVDIVKQSSEVVLDDQVEVDSGTLAWIQTQKRRMSPAPETDNEEEVESKMDEGQGEVFLASDLVHRPFMLFRSCPWTLMMGLRTCYWRPLCRSRVTVASPKISTRSSDP